jgi:RNA polymerase sigma factor for flagellar operon FliA
MTEAADKPVALEAENTALQEQATQRRKLAALRAYSAHKPLLQDERIVRYLPLVSALAERAVSYLKPPLSFEDLVSAGTVGLVKAARDYDPGRDTEFKTYAYIRIKGAIIDELRAWSFVPAGLARQLRQMQQLAQQLAERKGSLPSDEELAAVLQIPLEEFYKRLDLGRGQQFLSLHSDAADALTLAAVLADGRAEQPARKLQRAELLEQLTEAIGQLPQKQRRTVVLYYHQGLTMKQIGEVLNITESRVSQLHASALFRLWVKLRSYYYESGE